MNTNAVCSALSVSEESEILMITSRGQAVRCPVLNIRETNRGSKGVKLVNLDKKDALIGISEVMELDEEKNVETDDIMEDDETTESVEVAGAESSLED